MQNFITPGQTLLGEKYVAEKEEKKRKENNPKNSGHFVPQQHLRAAHALLPDQKLELQETKVNNYGQERIGNNESNPNLYVFCNF